MLRLATDLSLFAVRLSPFAPRADRPRGLSVSLWLIILALSASGLAARLESGPSFTLLKEEAQVGDLYFGGSALRLDGRVEGSVAAACQSAAVAGFLTRNLYLACQTADISGAVQGDLAVICAGLHLSAPVGGALRAAAATAVINSRINQDALVACRDLTVGRNAQIAGDLIAACATLNINGTVHGDVRTAAGEIIVSGIVDGDIIASVGTRLVLTQDARVFGSVLYRSDFELDVGNEDAVFGDIKFTRRVHRAAELEDVKRVRFSPGIVSAFFLPFAIFSVLGALVAGFILVAVWKQTIRRALETCSARFGRTVGLGAIALLAGPAAILVAFLLVITIPAGAVGLLLYLVFLYLARVFAGMLLGRLVFRLFGGATASPWLYAPVGIVFAYALCSVPFVGWIIGLFAAVLGYGVIVELLGATRRA